MGVNTPFDEVIAEIAHRGYHAHRGQEHSDIVSEGIWRDLLRRCEPILEDFESGRVRKWLNVRAPGGRERKIDLFIGEPDAEGNPDLTRVRIGVENKSVVTAHRNKDARYDDLAEVLAAVYEHNQVAVLVATVIIGIAERVLNVPDRLKAWTDPAEFEAKFLPRLSKGDRSLWSEVNEKAISRNRPGDPQKTVDKFRSLPTRPMAHTHERAYDWVLLVPVFVDNVDPPSLPRPNLLGIDVDREYDAMLNHVCKAYRARWHP